jgi:5,10-methylenetetrahydromethanopterin reductase
MREHTRAGSPQAETLDAGFVDHFGIVGSPEHCVERLHGLADLGVERFVIVGPSLGSDRDAATQAAALFAQEVLPHLR